MKTVKERIEAIKNELRYNSGPAISYIRVSTQDARMLIEQAEENSRLRESIDNERKVKDVLARKYRAEKTEKEQLHKALEYYADKKHYEPYAIVDVNPCDITEDGGYIAREALAIGEESNAL